MSRHHHSDINKCFDNSYFEQIDKSSLAYIGRPYTYIQSGLFIGPSDIVFKMCKEVCDMVEIDLKSNIIPQWHDESYLNKWCIEHTNLVKKDQKLQRKETRSWFTCQRSKNQIYFQKKCYSWCKTFISINAIF